MSKYIPVIKNILLSKIAKYIEKSLNAGCSFKDIARYLCKDQQQSQKKSGCTGSATGITKAVFNNAHNFCVHRYHCKKSMPVARSFSAVSNVPPVQPATRHVRTFSKNDVTDSIKHLMCVMVVQKAINHCTIAHKYRYDAIFADRKYKECLSVQAGINMTRHELHQKDMVITPLIFQPVSISDYNESSRTRYVRENSVFLP